MTYVYYSITAIVTYFAWTWIHEMSHVVVLKKTVGLHDYKLFLYPHMYFKRFYWARVRYMPKCKPSGKQQFLISMAPRAADYVGIIILSIIVMCTEPALWSKLLVIFCFGSVVDLFAGSLGIREKSDIRVAIRAAPAMSIWTWRISQSFIVVLTTTPVVQFFME